MIARLAGAERRIEEEYSSLDSSTYANQHLWRVIRQKKTPKAEVNVTSIASITMSCHGYLTLIQAKRDSSSIRSLRTK